VRPRSAPRGRREEGQQSLGNHHLGSFECVGFDPNVARDVDPGEGLVEDDHGGVPCREVGEIARVLDGLDREFGVGGLGRGVALGVGGGETPFTDPNPGRGVERRDPAERVEYLGIGLARHRLRGPLADFLDPRLAPGGIERFEPPGGVVSDSALFEQGERVVVDLAGAIGGEELPGIVVLGLDRRPRDGRGPSRRDARSLGERRHVARRERALGLVERREAFGGFRTDAGDRFEVHRSRQTAPGAKTIRGAIDSSQAAERNALLARDPESEP